jgi:hypothetical protein
MVDLQYIIEFLTLANRFFAIHHNGHGNPSVFEELIEPVYTFRVPIVNSGLTGYVTWAASLDRTEQMVIPEFSQVH